MLMQTSNGSVYGGFKAFGAGSELSPGKSIYMPSEVGSDQLKYGRARLGGHKSNIRALQNVNPLVKKKELSPGLRTIMKERFSSLDSKTKKMLSPKKLPKINKRSK